MMCKFDGSSLHMPLVLTIIESTCPLLQFEYEKQLFEICEGNGDINTIRELVNQHGIDVNTTIDKVL